jgi:CRP/FNR family cyclic AMP-dependent transcriptional regulator
MMRVSTIKTELRSLPMFAACSNKQMATVSRLVTITDVKDGRVLTREGASAREVFLVIEGCATVVRNGNVVGKLQRGELFGEHALLECGARGATVTADGPMAIGVLTPREFASLLDTAPEVAHDLAEALIRRLRSQLATATSANIPSPSPDPRSTSKARV